MRHQIKKLEIKDEIKKKGIKKSILHNICHKINSIFLFNQILSNIYFYPNSSHTV